jgi:hypothetical protein
MNYLFPETSDESYDRYEVLWNTLHVIAASLTDCGSRNNNNNDNNNNNKETRKWWRWLNAKSGCHASDTEPDLQSAGLIASVINAEGKLLPVDGRHL